MAPTKRLANNPRSALCAQWPASSVSGSTQCAISANLAFSSIFGHKQVLSGAEQRGHRNQIHCMRACGQPTCHYMPCEISGLRVASANRLSVPCQPADANLAHAWPQQAQVRSGTSTGSSGRTVRLCEAARTLHGRCDADASCISVWVCRGCTPTRLAMGGAVVGTTRERRV
jgi:hypothetical protein